MRVSQLSGSFYFSSDEINTLESIPLVERFCLEKKRAAINNLLIILMASRRRRNLMKCVAFERDR